MKDVILQGNVQLGYEKGGGTNRTIELVRARLSLCVPVCIDIQVSGYEDFWRVGQP